MKSPEIKIFTGMRFIAALCVLISHTYSDVFPYTSKLGGIGVFYFFVLSGFILSYNYQDRILNDRSIGFVWEFLIKRLVRIYPIYFLILLLWILLNFSSINFTNIFVNLLLLQSFSFKLSTLTINPPSWSISVEFFFYICFIPIIRICNGSIKKILLLMISINFLWLYIFTNHISQLEMVYGYYSNPYYRLIDFMGGVLLFNIFKVCDFSIYFIKNNVLLSILEIFVCCLPLCFSILIDGKFLKHIFIYHTIFLLLIVLIFVVMIKSSSTISQLLSSKYFIKLGEASYNLYLIHWLFLFEIIKPVSLYGKFFTDIIIVLLSLLVYKLIEYPLHKKLLYQLNRVIK